MIDQIDAEHLCENNYTQLKVSPMVRHILLSFALVALLPTITFSQDADAKRADALEHFVGSWQATVTEKPAKWNPDGATLSVSEYTIRTLKGRFILGREISQPDGVKNLWLMKHDPESNSYPFWFFNSKDVFGGEWNGTWERASKMLTSQATDTPKGWTSRGTNHFPDNKSNHVTAWMKDESGTLLFDREAKKIRQADEAGKKILATWSNTEKADTPISSEMKVLERLNGSWEFVAVAQPAEWTPKEVQTTGSIERTWALNRSLVLETSQSSDEKEGMHLFTYDPKQKAFRSWWFSSDGHTSKATGRWDSVSETISFESDLGNQMVGRSAIRFIDEDHHDARVVVTELYITNEPLGR